MRKISLYPIAMPVLALLTLISSVAHAHEMENCTERSYYVTYYYGEASCDAWSETQQAWISFEQYVPRWDQPTIRFYEDWWDLNYTQASCEAQLPHSDSEKRTYEKCDTVSHSHTTIATAYIHSFDMRVSDQSCRWGGWQYYSYVRTNRLYCGGVEIGYVTQSMREGYTGGSCQAELRDFENYHYSKSGSGGCNIKIDRLTFH